MCDLNIQIPNSLISSLKEVSHIPVDHTEQSFHQMGQVGYLSVLIWKDGPVHGGQLGQALKRVLCHVRIFSDLPVHLKERERLWIGVLFSDSLY